MEKEQRWMWWVLGVAILLVSIRFVMAFRFVFATLLVLAPIAVGGYILYQYIRNRRAAKAYSGSLIARVTNKLEVCRELYDENQLQLETIRNDIRELREKLGDGRQLSLANKQESERLLKAFEREYRLRQTKEGFFKTCIEKLENLLFNQQMSEEIEAKKRRLLELQEDKYEELAELEALRYDLESDSYYVDAIDELSQKMIESRDYEQASGLQLELEKMTESIKRLNN